MSALSRAVQTPASILVGTFLAVWTSSCLSLILTLGSARAHAAAGAVDLQVQYSVNVPAVVVSVVLTASPVVILSVVGGGWLVAGLSAGFGG